MLFRPVVILIVMLVSNVAFAQPEVQNPCSLIGLQGSLRSGACLTSTNDGIFPNVIPNVAIHGDVNDVNAKLIAVAVLELRTLNTLIKKLGEDMNSYRVALGQAQSGFEVATKTSIEKQESWRKTALEKTLADVQLIPAKLAVDEDLRKALLAVLKQQLADDPTFVQAVRDAAR